MASFLGSPAFVTLPQPITRASSQAPPPPQPQNQPSPKPPPPPQQLKTTPEVEVQQGEKSSGKSSRSRTNVESTDWIATNLTRRFGLGAGLAWAGFLAFGVISEQIKTRLEVSQEEAQTRDVEKEQEVILPNGIIYYDLRVGGGATPRPGDLVVIDVQGKVKGSTEVFVDTFEAKKPLALVLGSRPYSKGICEGIEYVLTSMKAGGKRRVIIPPSLGFGDEGVDLGSSVQIPSGTSLEYVIQVDKVSIAPA
ncbi:chaperone [Lithospermum erythrorhizon]|uniref:peptidylprolyl isomerase n=1 Tax=Lithospermum erythrorhizon TaxID=34254 RepID=A0AAV3P4Q4_LITER